MAFDGLFTAAMRHELTILEGGRISKIHQPNEHEVLLHIRSQGKNHRLLCSIHPSYARIQLTNEQMTNPSEPTHFCMVLRKHIESGVITSIEQIGVDRILHLHIKARNEIGDEIDRILIMELMGRHSNLILVDPETTKIIDSMKHLSAAVNRHRTVLPGFPYIAPPEQNKQSPMAVSHEQLLKMMEANDPQLFVQQLAGFSFLTAQELTNRLQTAQDPMHCYQQFLTAFFTQTEQPSLAQQSHKLLFSAISLTHLEATQPFNSLQELLDKAYFERAERERVRSQAVDLERWLTNEQQKLLRKQKKLLREQKQAEQLDTFQLYGELITATSYAIQKGQTEVTVDNYYEPGTTVTISLDARKNAIENAQVYYRRYRKAKNALIQLAEQLTLTEQELIYFDNIKQQVLQASPDDIAEIREELIEEGYLKKKRSKKKIKKTKKPQPENYCSSTGIAISVGKNNKQNDFVTFKLANRSDIWLHTKDIPGSHVIIHSNDPDEQTLLEAAQICAYFSKARESSSVPVDYTEVRHVKKPNGAKPGFVIYFEQKTLFVTPEEDIIRALRIK